MNIIYKPSPNFSYKKSRNIEMIVIHSTGGNMPGCLDWLIDKKSKVSCHYLIDFKGYVYQLVEEKDIAWHAGVSEWKGIKHCNLRSIGIELENDNKNQKYTPVQLLKLLDLVADLVIKYNISGDNLVRHSDISPGRKVDPVNFEWIRFKALVLRCVTLRLTRELSCKKKDIKQQNSGSLWQRILQPCLALLGKFYQRNQRR